MDRDNWISLHDLRPTEKDCYNGYLLVWHAYQRTLVIKIEQINCNQMYTHWRPVPITGWISVSSRLPTADDGDVNECVLIKDIEDGIIVSGWHRFLRDRFCIAWQHMPLPPDDYIKYRNTF